MPPARASPGMVAVASGSGRPLRPSSRSCAALRGARGAAALVEAEVGRFSRSGPRAVGRRTPQLKSVPGQPQGQPHPTYFRPRRPLASTTLPRPSGDIFVAPATAIEQNAHIYRGNYSYSNAALRE